MIQVKTNIVCDLCGEGNEFYSTVEESVKEAEKEGWYVKKNSDEVCCPSCKSKIEDMGFLNPNEYAQKLQEKDDIIYYLRDSPERKRIVEALKKAMAEKGVEGLVEAMNEVKIKK